MMFIISQPNKQRDLPTTAYSIQVWSQHVFLLRALNQMMVEMDRTDLFGASSDPSTSPPKALARVNPCSLWTRLASTCEVE